MPEASDILAEFRRRLAKAKRIAIAGALTEFDIAVVVKRAAQACKCSEAAVKRAVEEASDALV